MSASRPFAIVTGASTGSDFELAKRCAKEGYDLLIVLTRPRSSRRRAPTPGRQVAQAALEKSEREYVSRAAAIDAERAFLEKRFQTYDSVGNRKGRTRRVRCAKRT